MFAASYLGEDQTNYIEVNVARLRLARHEQTNPGDDPRDGGMIESWDQIMPRFARGFRVLRYDTRGCGLSEKVRGELSVDLLSDDLLAQFDRLA